MPIRSSPPSPRALIRPRTRQPAPFGSDLGRRLAVATHPGAHHGEHVIRADIGPHDLAFTGLVLDLLLPVPGSRVVVVTSPAHRAGRIDFGDLRYDQRYRRGVAPGRPAQAAGPGRYPGRAADGHRP